MGCLAVECKNRSIFCHWAKVDNSNWLNKGIHAIFKHKDSLKGDEISIYDLFKQNKLHTSKGMFARLSK